MRNLIQKELNFFFSSYSSYILIFLFLLCNSLFLWIFDNNINIFNNSIASLHSFFIIMPILLTIFIPIITMNVFSSETESGNIEILLTKPLSKKEIVLSKYLSCSIISIIMILPTISYPIIVSYLSNNTIDNGEIISAYIGLIFIIVAFNSIGVFVSSVSNTQIMSFLITIFLCWFFYFGIDLIIEYIYSKQMNLTLSFFCIQTHYISLKKGIIFISDIIYFFSFCLMFIILAFHNLRLNEKN